VCLQNGYQKDVMCSKEIELHAQNMITILGSMANTIGEREGDLYNPFNEHNTPPVGNKQDDQTSSGNHEERREGLALFGICHPSRTNCVFRILQEVGSSENQIK
jgi:hypothetical protein